jgi:hypothetical protein
MEMTLLADLGVGDGGLMLVSPPDSVLAEAGRRSPRPSFASSIMTAEPTGQIAWWPEGSTFTPVALSRLRWMLETASGRGWIVADPSEDVPLDDNTRRLIKDAGLVVEDERDLGAGQSVLTISAGGPR